MTKTLHATRKLTFEGAVDAGGHILEPPDLWERYLAAAFTDEGDRRAFLGENGRALFDIGA